MEKKQVIEIICVIAGFTLAIKAIDYLQFFITGIFQLLYGQGYGELYYFFIYLTTIAIYFASSYILITQARGISVEISKRLDPSDILIDLESRSTLEYALIIIGGITLISGLSNFLTSVVRSVAMEGVLTISGNMIWLNGLIKMLIGALIIYKARSLSRLIKK
ncbi:MAG TPA: hypothetical protein VK994_02475 [Bacteroidales bacterium]|nr:hypothetical protein [Bacteroidales bacterium]